MKIVCDSCGAKYSIADEKVLGKVFKIRCKKCSNVIVVKGNASGETAAAVDNGDMGAAAGAAEWYVVIDGEQAGPITVQEVEAYFMSGRIAADTYGWRDGMGDWQHVADIPEFAHLSGDVAGPNEATQIADGGGYGGGGYGEVDATNVMQSPLGGPESDPTMSDSPAAMGYGDPYPADPGYGESYGFGSEVSEENGGYGGGFGGFDSGGGYGGGVGGELAAAGRDDDDGGAGMFAAFDGGADSDFMSFGDSGPSHTNGTNGSNGSNGGGGAALADNMVGQRNENSVLFSLSSLDGVAGGGGGKGGSQKEDVPLTEGSGLIDIQALATAHKSMSTGGGEFGGPDDGNIDPFAQGTMAMPALMPMGSHRSNKGLIAAAVGGGVLLLTLIVVLLVTVMSKDDTPQQPQIVEKVIVQEKLVERPVDQAAEREAAEAEQAALAAAAADPKKVEEEEPEAAEDDKPAEKSGRKRSNRKSQQKASAPTEEKEPPKSTKPKGDGIDRLLGQLDEKGSDAPQKKSSSTAKKSLDRSDVKNTIGRYQGRISTCAKSHNSAGKKGTVKVKFFIQPSGRVRGETIVSSGFKGTDVGGCVEKVVGQMKFPETSASKDVPVTYPFILN